MGVNNVLPILLPSIGKKINLVQVSNNFKRCNNSSNSNKQTSKRKRRRSNNSNIRIAIDVSIWISQACHGKGPALIDERQLSNYGRAELRGMCNVSKSCIDTTSNESNEKENQYISICTSSVIKRVEKLQDRFSNCELLVVFDGKTPPVKEKECRERREVREKASRIRDSEISCAHLEDDDAILLTKVRAAKKAGAEKKIPFMVSPYEADSQLAYLSKQNLVDLIITEDSDLIAYGAKAILFKVDKDCNSGQLMERKEFAFADSKFSLIDFSDSMLASMFVAAGCDYCNSLPGIGIGRARDIIKEAFHSTDLPSKTALQRVFHKLYLKSNKNSSDDEKIQYESLFLSALILYRNAIVFDPIKLKCVYFSSDGDGDSELLEYQPYADIWNDSKAMEDIVGVLPTEKEILDIVEGKICPRTLATY